MNYRVRTYDTLNVIIDEEYFNTYEGAVKYAQAKGIDYTICEAVWVTKACIKRKEVKDVEAKD